MKLNCESLLSVLTFFALASSPHGEKDLVDQFEKWNYREGASKVNILGIRSVTGTLEKWGNEIFSDVKDTLMYKPEILLPEYNGIRLLSEALDDLVKDMNGLNKRIGELHDRIDVIRRAAIRKSLRIGPENRVISPRRISNYRNVKEKITQPPHRPFPVKRRVIIRRRKGKK